MNARITDRIATAVIWTLSAGIVALLASFLAYLVVKGGRYISFHFLVNGPRIVVGGGVGPELFNSFYLLFLTMLISIPLGVGAGIYMSEFAPANKVTEVIRLATETLASLPSIIVGLFGLLLFVQRLGLGFSVIAGALALAVFNLPIIERVAENSLRAVPAGLREGSLALGMTRWQTIRTVLLPSALPGLVTGFILTAGRIFGEAAALLFTAGPVEHIAQLARHQPLQRHLTDRPAPPGGNAGSPYLEAQLRRVGAGLSPNRRWRCGVAHYLCPRLQYHRAFLWPVAAPAYHRHSLMPAIGRKGWGHGSESVERSALP